jgi:cell division protein FtsL
MAVVPATRRSVAIPQPRPTPAQNPNTQNPKTTRERRPQLRVVDEPTPRRWTLGVITALVVGAVFAVLFGLVVFHTLLLQNQQKLDHLDAQVSDAQGKYQSLRLQVAQLEAPQRIIDVATHELGMVPPDGTTYLTPAAGSGAGTDGASGSGASQGDATNEAAAASNDTAAWNLVKPYLGAAP